MFFDFPQADYSMVSDGAGAKGLDSDASYMKVSMKDAMDTDVETVQSFVLADATSSADERERGPQKAVATPEKIDESDKSLSQGESLSLPMSSEGSFRPTASMEALVFAADSEETRDKNFENLRALVSNLSDLDRRVNALHEHLQSTSEATGRVPTTDQTAHEASASVEEVKKEVDVGDFPAPAPFLAPDEPDWGGDEDKEEKPTPEDFQKAMGQPVSQEETQRLTELLEEQKRMLEIVVAEQEASKKARETQQSGHEALDAVAQGRVGDCIDWVDAARPEQVREVVDANGLNLLHWAARENCLELVFKLLAKCPDLANRATKASRTPPSWTPLMMLAQNQVPNEAMGRVNFERADACLRQMSQALVNHMSLLGLQQRGGTYATVLHLAAANANWQVTKKALWRVHDLAGNDAVLAILSMKNQTATSLEQFVGSGFGDV